MNKYLAATKKYIGTAGWTYEDWVGVFYSANQSKDYNWLRFYSAFFNLVEVNATYYTYIGEKIVANWISVISEQDDFKFIIKLHQDFTHIRRFNRKSLESVVRILDLLDDNNRLGGLLIQFPYSFAYSGEGAKYIAGLGNMFEKYRLFFELRHNSWNKDTLYEYFEKKQYSLCIIDQPSIGESLTFFPKMEGKHSYFRFHGRNREAWLDSIKTKTTDNAFRNERYRYKYSISELKEFISKIDENISAESREIYLVTNNHPGGGAVVNALELKIMLKEIIKYPIPSGIINKYPEMQTLLG